LATDSWMVLTISLIGAITGYFASSQLNLHIQMRAKLGLEATDCYKE
jgi:hypothetical protein